MDSQENPASFEESFEQLQRAVEQLEEGGLPLESSLELFERSMALMAHCHAILDRAELRLTKLTDEHAALLEGGPEGWPVEE